MFIMSNDMRKQNLKYKTAFTKETFIPFSAVSTKQTRRIILLQRHLDAVLAKPKPRKCSQNGEWYSQNGVALKCFFYDNSQVGIGMFENIHF